MCLVLKKKFLPGSMQSLLLLNSYMSGKASDILVQAVACNMPLIQRGLASLSYWNTTQHLVACPSVPGQMTLLFLCVQTQPRSRRNGSWLETKGFCNARYSKTALGLPVLRVPSEVPGNSCASLSWVNQSQD